MAIDSTQLKSTIWNAFRTLIANNVTSVTIKGKNGPNTKTVTVGTTSFSQSYPDTVFDNEDNYPIIIINSPDFNFSPITYRNRELSGTIEFEIFTTQSEAADKFADLINSTIMNDTTLNTEGLEELELDSTDSNSYDRNKMSIHSRMLVWRYKYAW